MARLLKKRVDLSKMRARLRSGRPLGDEVRFLKTLFESPRLTGAVSPSGRFLARAMARAVGPVREGLVVELGPGTGPVTRALIEQGVPPDQLILVEYEATFCRLLSQRFPGVRVVQGDAYALRRTLADLADRPIRAVVSSLPLLNQPPARRAALIEDAFALMAPGGVFVQFTYGVASPIPRPASAGRFSAHATAPIWLNLPPARVWTYRADPNASAPAPLFSRLCEGADRMGEEWVGKAEAAGRLLRAKRGKLGAKVRAHAKDILSEARRRKPLDIFRNLPPRD
ncbi:class I SAM-dependent methyltransferase [Methylocapsa sp. S129]|uniref:class I SAM-dependent methyltransferase n=1 Tax=Methylocapsa sp. S129 TaxID=1641869 RepID=UPI001FED7396|nr:methyltransferase domain-containing protein [Methylocapsa sp. S129]